MLLRNALLPCLVASADQGRPLIATSFTKIPVSFASTAVRLLALAALEGCIFAVQWCSPDLEPADKEFVAKNRDALQVLRIRSIGEILL